MSAIRRFNVLLDALPRAGVVVGGRTRSSFRVFGSLGVLASVALTQAVAAATGRSAGVMIIVTAAALAISWCLAMGTAILTGRATLVWYHHQIAVLIISAVVLRVLGQPVPGYLDLVALGLGTFLIFGRLGCLLVGCCHGRPSRIGIRYGAGLRESGFDVRLLGARLAPTPLVESAVVLIIVAAGMATELAGDSADGAVVVWWVLAYGVLRFGLEFLRGDLGRPVLVGATEAQWTAVVLGWSVVGAGLAGVLPAGGWPLVVAVGLLGALAVVMACGVGGGPSRRLARALRRPEHLHELAESVRDALLVADQPASVGRAEDRAARTEAPPLLIRTSAGLALSAGSIAEPVPARFVTVSAVPVLTEPIARMLSRQIVRLRFPDRPYRLISGGAGVYHLVVPAGDRR